VTREQIAAIHRKHDVLSAVAQTRGILNNRVADLLNVATEAGLLDRLHVSEEKIEIAIKELEKALDILKSV
jgi:hypothetical protein